MARDQLKLMEAAIILAEELNFSRAARRLHISQPALTKQIAELEGRLGVRLFDRDKQTVSLTDAGRDGHTSKRLASVSIMASGQLTRPDGRA